MEEDALKAAIDDIYGGFDDIVIEDEQDYEFDLPDAGVITQMADGSYFTLTIKDDQGRELAQMDALDYGPLTFGLPGSDLENAAKVSVTTLVHFEVLVMPISECLELGVARLGNAGEGERCMIYGGFGETRTISGGDGVPPDGVGTEVTVRQITDGASTTLLDQAPISGGSSAAASITLDPGPSVLIVEASTGQFESIGQWEIDPGV
ncbi:hypothetical protein [Propionimicrobium sp. PCR01-08-3]|uniref:hypothetical protein n=1 Tax=Propionimicrobium sp. PCR01-08-3 TaxID=3052086 RepID=UPI00255CC35A|nr:hypothetical protein [Propionimicrobium sp. PCR01-08-3]WIY83693.1 hypothetical protein QQ658_04895 [Propionimicrobium sp. PCR01-08-3]